MTTIATALTEEPLARRHFCGPGCPIDSCNIAYGPLCELAGYSDIVRSVGRYLQETAVGCAEHHYLQLNALAVNGETRMPGDSYDVVPGCSLLNWKAEVRGASTLPATPPMSNDVAGAVYVREEIAMGLCSTFAIPGGGRERR